MVKKTRAVPSRSLWDIKGLSTAYANFTTTTRKKPQHANPLILHQHVALLKAAWSMYCLWASLLTRKQNNGRSIFTIFLLHRGFPWLKRNMLQHFFDLKSSWYLGRLRVEELCGFGQVNMRKHLWKETDWGQPLAANPFPISNLKHNFEQKHPREDIYSWSSLYLFYPVSDM